MTVSCREHELPVMCMTAVRRCRILADHYGSAQKYSRPDDQREPTRFLHPHTDLAAFRRHK